MSFHEISMTYPQNFAHFAVPSLELRSVLLTNICRGIPQLRTVFGKKAGGVLQTLHNKKGILIMLTIELLYIKYIRSMLRSGYTRKDIKTLNRDIYPFFRYLVNECGVPRLSQVTARMISAYTDRLINSCPDRSSFYIVLDVNNKLCAIRMFCLQMFIRGAIPHDLSRCAVFVPMPEHLTQRQELYAWKR